MRDNRQMSTELFKLLCVQAEADRSVNLAAAGLHATFEQAKTMVGCSALGGSMSLFRSIALMFTLALAALSTYATETRFSGTWSVDLRTPEQKAQRAECGEASFVLHQPGKKITGSHTMATVGCGRLNEGGEGTVKGHVVGNRAHLVVTSGRNGAVVKGIATLRNEDLYWETTEEVKAGEPEGDSPHIFGKGLLTRVSK